MRLGSRTLGYVKLSLDNLPASLQSQRQTLAECSDLMDRVMPLRAVYLFGSHARGEAGPDSDVDLCLVAEGAERQLEAPGDFERRWGMSGPARPSRCCPSRRSGWPRSARRTPT